MIKGIMVMAGGGLIFWGFLMLGEQNPEVTQAAIPLIIIGAGLLYLVVYLDIKLAKNLTQKGNAQRQKKANDQIHRGKCSE